jgi:hypothetical protein
MMNTTIEHGRKILRNGCEKLTLLQAKIAGQGLYWPEKPCRNGHHYWRYTKSHQCLSCVAKHTSRKWRRKEGGSKMLAVDRLLEQRRQREEDPYLEDK